MATTTELKTAAIWARVSTTGQRELSLDTQIAQCQQLLKSKGYIATKILSIDFCSLDLSVSKEFQQLQHMIEAHEIDAVVCYDRDRLQADGIDRLVFLSQLKENRVDLLVCNGAPIMDSDEGSIVELALALGKKRSVLRARTGSRDGLRARVTLMNKPASHQKVFGYDWDIATETLSPNADYPTVKLIFDLALAGYGYDKIARELQKRGIRTPHGSTWGRQNVGNLIHNPIYAGRYMALRTSTIRSDKPGYKLQHRPESEQYWIKEVTITESPITWEQRTVLFEQIQRHIKLSSRNSNRQYLLRGLIESNEYIGKRGGHVKYHGRSLPNHGYGYICEVNNKTTHYISGPALEATVMVAITNLFESESSSFWQKMNNLEKINRPELEAELLKQQAKLQKTNEAQADIEIRKTEMLSDVYELARAKLNVQRKALEERQREIQDQLESASNIEEKSQSFDEIRNQFLANAGKFTDSQWRLLLETLECRIRIVEKSAETATDPYFTKLEQFLFANYKLNNKVIDAACLLKDFDAVMFITAPFRNPEKIAGIASGEPWQAFLLCPRYNLEKPSLQR
jgi:hypothetical protein